MAFKNNNQYDSSLRYLLIIEDQYSQVLPPEQEINNKIEIFEALVQKKDFEQAGPRLSELESLLYKEKIEDPLIQAGFLQVKGAYMLGLGQDSAQYYLERSIEIRIRALGEKDTTLHYAWNKLGNYFLMKGDYKQAIICHKTALEISFNKKNPNNFNSAISYQNLGIAVHLKGDY